MSHRDQHTTLVLATVAALLLALLSILARRVRRPPLPPGPKSSFFGFGRSLMPITPPWRTYAEWRNTYGRHVSQPAHAVAAHISLQLVLQAILCTNTLPGSLC